MADLLNKTITVSAKEEKLAGGKPVMKIKDEKGLTYSVWKFKQDGTESVAWGQIPDLNTATQIGYVEEVKNDPTYGTTTYRTIRNFNPDLANTTPKQETRATGANNASKGASTEEFWDKKAYKQCLWNFWLKHKAGKGDDFNTVWAVFQDIEQDADKRFATGMEKARVMLAREEFMDEQKAHPQEPLPEELPTIQQDEDPYNVDGIPF